MAISMIQTRKDDVGAAKKCAVESYACSMRYDIFAAATTSLPAIISMACQHRPRVNTQLLPIKLLYFFIMGGKCSVLIIRLIVQPSARDFRLLPHPTSLNLISKRVFSSTANLKVIELNWKSEPERAMNVFSMTLAKSGRHRKLFNSLLVCA